MVYFICGTVSGVRFAIEKQLQKKPYTVVSSFLFSEEMAKKYACSPRLFLDTAVVFVDALATKERISFFKSIAGDFSTDVFFVESSDSVLKQSAVRAMKGTVLAGKEKKASAAARPKIYAFDVALAIIEKNKKQAWLLYQKALQNDEDPNAIHSAVWWSIKQLAIASPRFGKYQKSYTRQAISGLATWWMGLLHDTRKKNTDVSLTIEKAILEL